MSAEPCTPARAWEIWRRFERAERKGTGLRLSADDVATLYVQDAMVEGVVDGIRATTEEEG